MGYIFAANVMDLSSFKFSRFAQKKTLCSEAQYVYVVGV